MLCGWWTSSDFYGFKGDHYIIFCYIGQNVFHITIYMGEVFESGVNRYLEEVEGRELLTIGPFDHFSIKLSLLHIYASYLVSLVFLFFLNVVPYILFLLLTYYFHVLEEYSCSICGISSQREI